MSIFLLENSLYEKKYLIKLNIKIRCFYGMKLSNNCKNFIHLYILNDKHNWEIQLTNFNPMY